MTKRKKSEVAEVTPHEVIEADSTTPSPAESPEATAPPIPPVEEIERRLEEAESRNRELFARLQYAQADLENVRKRADREIVEGVRFANERLLGSLLPILDELDAAAAMADAGSAAGLGMVRDHLVQVLAEAGFEQVPTDVPFDPYLHEAVGRANHAELPEGTIAEVVQKGYRFHFKLLRPAKVIVVRKGGGT